MQRYNLFPGPDLRSFFPDMIEGDPEGCQWPYLRKQIPHCWYVDASKPDHGFISTEEACIVYQNALQVNEHYKGHAEALEVGTLFGWSAAHIAFSGLAVDCFDPFFANESHKEKVMSNLDRVGKAYSFFGSVALIPGKFREFFRGTNKSSIYEFIFIDGDHEGDSPLQDAILASQLASKEALIMFHDLASPYVQKGFLHLANLGWCLKIYNTMQGLGVAWRPGSRLVPWSHHQDQKINWDNFRIFS